MNIYTSTNAPSDLKSCQVTALRIIRRRNILRRFSLRHNLRTYSVCVCVYLFCWGWKGSAVEKKAVSSHRCTRGRRNCLENLANCLCGLGKMS
ncbi:hypothetical protein E2C01_039074 [Portunus trituberculatus]|uniref:Uncharacterized protein n=1 Tax=Portunus trituberculatus TaxID=210409 RepID=A0A5B7FIV9_PORTR|nr:hypothetical protein [Portunus trituberculatus]